MNPSTTKPVVLYPRYTKLIIDYILTKHHDIPKRANEPHHTIASDDYVKYIFATEKIKVRGMGIHVVLLNEDIMETNAYKMYDANFKKVVVPMTQPQPVESSQGTYRTPSAHRSPKPSSTSKKKKEKESGESRVPKIPLKFKINKRQLDPDISILTAERIDIDNITEAQQFSYTLAKIAKEFADSIILSQENLGRIDPRSEKERLEAMNVDYVAIVEEDESVKVALIRKKKAVHKEHARTKSELSSQVTNDLTANVPPLVEAFLHNYMNNTILNVHPSSSSSISHLKYQLHLKMKNDPQSQAADSALWDVLKEKFKKSSTLPNTCRPEASRKCDHDDHPNDHSDRENGSKRQKTTKGSLSTNVTSSSKTTTVRKPNTYASQPTIQEYDGWLTVQEIDDEDIFEEATTKFLAKIHGKKWVPTAADFHKMKFAYDDIMKYTYKTGA
ncbi:hypothetical protein Tco_0446775 [Tanacetum coccineum]